MSEVCNSWRVAGDPQPGFSNAVSYTNSLSKYANQVPSGAGGWATLDAIEIGNNMSFDVLDGDEVAETGERQALRLGGGGMTADQERAAISIYMIAKTPICTKPVLPIASTVSCNHDGRTGCDSPTPRPHLAVIGADVTTLSGHSLEAYSNSDLIAIHQDPLAAPGRQIRVNDSMIIWGCALSGNRTAAVLLNIGDSPVDITVTWADLDNLSASVANGMSSCTADRHDSGFRTVTDVWQHKTVGYALRTHTLRNGSL